MTELRTFSAAVDTVVNRSKRRDRFTDIISHARSTIRECSLRAFFKRDMVEDQLTANAVPFIWNYPDELRLLQTARYRIYDRRGDFIYPKEVVPGKRQIEFDHYYYGGPGYYVFVGVEVGVEIDIAYYRHLKPLAYYEENARPTIFTLETMKWTYFPDRAPSGLEDVYDEEFSKELVTNWILSNYFDTVVEGTMAKLYKTLDDPRASSTYALYKSYQNDLVAAEPSASLEL